MNFFLGGEGVGGGRIKLHDSTWERTFPDEGDEKILGWWGDSHSGKKSVIPYIKTKKENSFQKILKIKPQRKYLLSKHRFKFILFEYLDNKMNIDAKEIIIKFSLVRMKEAVKMRMRYSWNPL